MKISTQANTERAIINSKTGYTKRVYLLLLLNIIGVIIYIGVMIGVILTALGVTFPEPELSPVLTQYLQSLKDNNTELIARSGTIIEDNNMVFFYDVLFH